MKYALPLFCLSLLSLLATDYFHQIRPALQFQRAGLDHPSVLEFRRQLTSVIDAKDSPLAERTYPDAYINRIVINPGFRIVHDPSLGGELRVTAPETVFDYLKLSERSGRLEPTLSHPVRLAQPIEVKLNVAAHGSKSVDIQFRRAHAGRTKFQPDLVTVGPLSLHLLLLNYVPEHRLDLAVTDLVLTSNSNLQELYGTADRVELYLRDSTSTESLPAAIPNLQIREVIDVDIR